MTRPRTRGTLQGPRGLLAVIAVVVGGCTPTGSVTFLLDQPALSLDPLADPRLARLALSNEATGDPIGVVPFRLDARMQLAELPTGTYDFRLEGQSTGGQLLALARAFDVPVRHGSTREVMLHLRKPLAYIAGGTVIEVVDTSESQDSSQPLDPIQVAGVKGVTGLAATRAGDLLLATVDLDRGAGLVWYDTATHSEVNRVALAASADALVLDPRDRYAAALHTLQQSITIIDLAQLRAGATDQMLTSFDIAYPAHATFDAPGTLWVASSTATACGSGSPGMLHHVDVSGNQVGDDSPLQLPAYTTDVAWNPLAAPNGRPLLAIPCTGAGVVEVEAGGTVTGPLVSDPVYDVVIDGHMLYTVGWVNPSDPLTGKVWVLDLASGQPQQVTFTYQPMLLSVPGVQDQYGNAYYLDVPVVDFKALDVVVSPNGTRVAFIHEITYQQTTDIPASGTSAGCSRMDINVVEHGYSLVDLEAAQLVSTTATDYEVHCLCNEHDDGSCISNLVPNAPYIPTAATVLMGAE